MSIDLTKNSGFLYMDPFFLFKWSQNPVRRLPLFHPRSKRARSCPEGCRSAVLFAGFGRRTMANSRLGRGSVSGESAAGFIAGGREIVRGEDPVRPWPFCPCCSGMLLSTETIICLRNGWQMIKSALSRRGADGNTIRR